MPMSFEKSQIIHASPSAILFLINNFEAYKNFLPGCIDSSKLPNSEGNTIRGKLVFSILNKIYDFESINKTNEYEVNITQAKGPFLSFDASWKLEEISSEETLVSFNALFEIPFFLRIFAKQALVDRMGQKFLDAFSNQLKK